MFLVKVLFILKVRKDTFGVKRFNRVTSFLVILTLNPYHREGPDDPTGLILCVRGREGVGENGVCIVTLVKSLKSHCSSNFSLRR